VFLKALTLKGFKSFAEATRLEMEPGITVVVGPNGSGKSNIVDAIGWVLGAQAPSAVRSQKMDDVIFAGTTSRPALGRAEVALTIDNSAGLLPIEFTEVTITRTLFRTGDSEYSINGVPCRLLDIQELLSDTGVGRQQHVIVSQGQIDAILNARPEDRRLVIEEAAGVLKYRRRKEKAERRLAGTEANLVRLQDLLREVRRQLRPLERQAHAARRHGDLLAELTALRVHLAGREIEALEARLASNSGARAELTAAESALKARLRDLDGAVAGTERQLSAMGGDDLGDALVRFESLRERARGLAAVLAERRRGLDRERGAFVDQEVIASLEAEAARLADELIQVGDAAAELAPSTDALAAAEAELAADRATFERDWPGGVAVPAGTAAAEVRGELGALRAAVERGDAEATRVQARLAALDDRTARVAGEAQRLRGELEGADESERPLLEAFSRCERIHADAAAQVAAAQAARRAADADRHSWAARADALAQALDAARARAGAERLAGVPGVLGTVLDLVAIDDGWEAAFEAAAGDALAAVVVEDLSAGRRALDELHRGDVSGAVLALGASRPMRLFPEGGEPLRRHLRAVRPDVEGLLDVLVGGAVVVDGGWEAALDLALAHPDAVVVTRHGDRFGISGWRIGGPAAGATGTALIEARERAVSARAIADAADAALTHAQATLVEAQRAEAEAARALDDHDGRVSAAADALQRVESDRRDAATEADALRGHLSELTEHVERDRVRVADLAASLPDLEAEEASALERGRAAAAARARLEARARAVASLRTELRVRTAAIDERRHFLQRRHAEVEARLTRDATERHEAERRRVALDERHVALERLAALVGERVTVVERELAALHERRRRQSEGARAVAAHLDGLRKERAGAERSLEELRERARRVEVAEAETRLRLESAVEALRRELDHEPGAAADAACPALPDGVTAAARVRELERELRLMGPINPLALEEFDALQERHGFLEAQLEDVKSSRRELGKIIRAVDSEIIAVFAAAFADVSENFERLFSTLFLGGGGRLRLTDPDDLLNTGIEVEARPSGKNVRKLSLLSGGERSLTALAFLFAVFRSRPSPFYVLDEVEAALDDVNLHRFLDLLHEFREEAQLIIVSHQKRTMEAADCLYGVTMQSGGSSRVLSERVSTPV